VGREREREREREGGRKEGKTVALYQRLNGFPVRLDDDRLWNKILNDQPGNFHCK
jgi:hypothetical protein